MASSPSSLASTMFAGTYEDAQGVEAIAWTLEPAVRRAPPGHAGFVLRTIVRGVELCGTDFDDLVPVAAERDDAVALSNCVLTAELPCVVERGGQRSRDVVSLRLQLPAESTARPDDLTLRHRAPDGVYEVVDEWLEDALGALAARLAPHTLLVCCFTCAFSDYSPAGHGLSGMACHRGAKQQYLSVRTKNDYWRVPVMEQVLETHVCDEHEPRRAGTGYRG